MFSVVLEVTLFVVLEIALFAVVIAFAYIFFNKNRAPGDTVVVFSVVSVVLRFLSVQSLVLSVSVILSVSSVALHFFVVFSVILCFLAVVFSVIFSVVLRFLVSPTPSVKAKITTVFFAETRSTSRQ